MKDASLQTQQTIPTTSRAIVFNWMDWLPYFEDSDASLEQKREWIETLWSIVMGFVDLGYDLKSTADICGEDIDLTAVLTSGVLDLELTKTDKEGPHD